jgi:hypothetical protein
VTFREAADTALPKLAEIPEARELYAFVEEGLGQYRGEAKVAVLLPSPA